MAEVTTGRINYIKNPSFDGQNTNFWTHTAGGTLTTSTTQFHLGTASLQVSKVTNTVNCGATISGYRIPVTATSTYTLSAYLKLPGEMPTRTFNVQIDWYDAASGGNAVGSAATETFSLTGFQVDPAYTPFEACYVTSTAPSGATHASVSIYQNEAEDLTANPQQYYTFFYIDAVMFEESDFLNGFIQTIPQEKENAQVEAGFRPVPYPKITGLELNADINFNGLILNTIDEDGILWICTDLEGWWGHPDPDIPNITRGQGDGSYDVRGRYAARDITLKGVFYPPSKEYVPIARDKLVRAMDLVKTGGWLIADEEPSKAAYVRMSGRPSIETRNARGRTEFEIGLRAGDPIKYEWAYGIAEDGKREVTVNVNTNETIENIGNTPVSLSFEVKGPLATDSTITNQTASTTITFNQALRGVTANALINAVSRTANVAKIQTTTDPNIITGDRITVANVAVDDNSFNGANLLVTQIETNEDISEYFVYYENPATNATVTITNVTADVANGVVNLASADVLTIDTYNQEVNFNGQTQGYRFYLTPVLDWITLEPGNNIMRLTDETYTSGEAPTLTIKYRSGWIG